MTRLLALTIACMVVMFLLAASQDIEVPIAPLPWNYLHVPAFCGLTLLWDEVFIRWGYKSRRALMAAAALAFLFGMVIELSQLHMPGRYASRADVVLNVIGIGLALLIAPFLMTRSALRNRRRGGGKVQ